MTDRQVGGYIRPSPNIWYHTETYELENQYLDAERLIESTMRQCTSFDGARVADIGCGTGFHLKRYIDLGGSNVVGIEPHPPLREAAQTRCELAGITESIEVVAGTAEATGLPSSSIDVAIARWAYFFGPGCETGLDEIYRILAPGGHFFVIDTDASSSTFGQWFSRWQVDHSAAAVQRFWRRHGFNRHAVTLTLHTPNREIFERIINIELSETVARAALIEHEGCVLDYAVNIWHKQIGNTVGTYQ